jgi:hypothetical protein
MFDTRIQINGNPVYVTADGKFRCGKVEHLSLDLLRQAVAWEQQRGRETTQGQPTEVPCTLYINGEFIDAISRGKSRRNDDMTLVTYADGSKDQVRTHCVRRRLTDGEKAEALQLDAEYVAVNKAAEDYFLLLPGEVRPVRCSTMVIGDETGVSVVIYNTADGDQAMAATLRPDGMWAIDFGTDELVSDRVDMLRLMVENLMHPHFGCEVVNRRGETRVLGSDMPEYFSGRPMTPGWDLAHYQHLHVKSQRLHKAINQWHGAHALTYTEVPA